MENLSSFTGFFVSAQFASILVSLLREEAMRGEAELLEDPIASFYERAH